MPIQVDLEFLGLMFRICGVGAFVLICLMFVAYGALLWFQPHPRGGHLHVGETRAETFEGKQTKSQTALRKKH